MTDEPLSFRDKVRTIAAPRSRTWHGTERKPVVDDRDGVIRGRHDEHWDGSQDATVSPRTLNVRMVTEEE